MEQEWIKIEDQEIPSGMYICKDDRGNEFPAVYASTTTGVKKWCTLSPIAQIPAYYRSLNQKN